VRSFQGASAKGTGRIVVPTSACQSVTGPHAVLQNEPSKELAFGWGPSFPDGREIGSSGAVCELGSISRGRGVKAVRRPGPGDRVFSVGVQVRCRNEVPKGDESSEMLSRETVVVVEVPDPGVVLES
jgi:hypothetical protein